MRISKAFKRYVSDVDKLVVAAECQQISSAECRENISRSLDQHLPQMTPEELKMLEVRFLAEVAECHERLSEVGLPVCGNDPKRPN
jgi:5'-deoxynucleotidase YfbR-like HD superfamily hydrolase